MWASFYLKVIRSVYMITSRPIYSNDEIRNAIVAFQLAEKKVDRIWYIEVKLGGRPKFSLYLMDFHHKIIEKYGTKLLFTSPSQAKLNLSLVL